MKASIWSVLVRWGLIVALIAVIYVGVDGLRRLLVPVPVPGHGQTAVPATMTAFPPGEIHQALASGLRIEEYALESAPSSEPLTFTPLQGARPEIFFLPSTPLKTYPGQSFDASGHLTSSVVVGNDTITVTQVEGDGTALGHGAAMQVARNGQVIETLQAGDSSPIGTLRGLWTYAGHWVLEIAYVTNHTGADNSILSEAAGRIFLDGTLLNERQNYQEAFGFQTMNGRPFYFFKRDGRIHVAYDGQEVLLGYAQIPHYGCCSAAALNPRGYEDGVTFFAQRDGRWYYVGIGITRN